METPIPSLVPKNFSDNFMFRLRHNQGVIADNNFHSLVADSFRKGFYMFAANMEEAILVTTHRQVLKNRIWDFITVYG